MVTFESDQSEPQATLKQSPSESKTIPNPSLSWISPKTTKSPGMEMREVRCYVEEHKELQLSDYNLAL